MSYCRSPIYIIRSVTGNIECFDVSDPDPSSQHHDGYFETEYKDDQQVHEHMRWHIRQFFKQDKIDEAHWLGDQLLDALTLPYYTKWHHWLDPWRWLFWRRYWKIETWIEEARP